MVVDEEEEEEHCGKEVVNKKEISVEAIFLRPPFDMLRTLEWTGLPGSL